MSRLLWDQPGERIYETGVDRGVLYLEDGSGVSWNGLLRVDENFDDEDPESSYFEGIKVFDAQNYGDFGAKLSAFTYPDEFLDFEGSLEIGPGLYVEDQNPKLFGLSYRTSIGNDTVGTDLGYKIHVFYNLLASVSSVSRNTITNSPSPSTFDWDISSKPEEISGYRPTAHIVFNSTLLDPTLLSSVEDLLYGTDAVSSRLPSISEFIQLATI